MTLAEAVASLSEYEDELTIYAQRPWSSESPVVLGQEADSGGRPPEAETRVLGSAN
jgi:hypothetical protein